MATQDLGALRARLMLESQQFSQGMKQAKDEMKGMGRSAADTARDMGRIQKASMAVGAAVAAGIGASVKVAANFEQAMARVKAISNATDEEFRDLTKIAQKMGETTQFSSVEAAGALEFLSMAGFKVKDQIAALPSVLNLAAAGNVDLARSADIVSNIMSGFGMKAEDTGKAVDVLVKTMTTANTDLPQLGEAMKYVAPVSAALGISFEDTATAIAKMSDAGIQGSQAGTTLRAAMLSLANPTGQTEKAMKELGINITDANGKMKPLPQLIGHIAEKMKGMTDKQKTATAAQLVGTEAVSGFLALLAIGEDGLKDYSKELQNAGGTADRVAKTQMDTLNGAFKEFQSALEGVGIKIGNEFLPEFKEIVKFGTDVVRMLGDLNPATATTGLKMGGAAAGIALVGSSLIKLIGTLRTAMFAMGPAGWVIAGLSIIGGLLVGVKSGYDEMNKVNLEAIKTKIEERDALESSIEEYENLRAKNKLTNDELKRFMDINSEIAKTTDPQVITDLKDEQEKLLKKSELTNDEMERFIDVNDKIIEKVPKSNTEISKQGNALLNNVDAAKEYAQELNAALLKQLELESQKGAGNYKNALLEEERIIKRITDLNDERLGHMDNLEGLQKNVIAEETKLKGMLEEKSKYTEGELDKQRIAVAIANKKLEKEEELIGKIAGKIIKEQESLDTAREQIKAHKEIFDQMIAIELKQVGINAKKGEEVRQVELEIVKTKEQLRLLEQNTSEAGKKTKKYQDAKKALEDNLTNLTKVKGRIEDIIRDAGIMNSELGKSISKTVTVNTRTSGSSGGAYITRHSGGVATPKLTDFPTANPIGDDSEESKHKARKTLLMIKILSDGKGVSIE